MNVFLGSLTLEMPGNSFGKHTYCNSISFDIDCGKTKDMHYNIKFLRQNFYFGKPKFLWLFSLDFVSWTNHIVVFQWRICKC